MFSINTNILQVQVIFNGNTYGLESEASGSMHSSAFLTQLQRAQWESNHRAAHSTASWHLPLVDNLKRTWIFTGVENSIQTGI